MDQQTLQQIINQIQSGNYDFTFGPNSPNATREDSGTYVGGPHSPAGGFSRNGGYAVPRKVYYSFTPQQRQQYGIMDIAPDWHGSRLEKYFGPDFTGERSGRNPSGSQEFNGGNYGDLPVSNLSDRPRFDNPQVLIGNETPQSGFPSTGGNLSQSGAYDPNYNYGSPNSWGSGGVTRSLAGALGTILGNATNLIVPGSGLITGRLGGMGAKALTNSVQNRQADHPPAGYGKPSGVGGINDNIGPKGGINLPDGYDPFGGLPKGFNESGRYEPGQDPRTIGNYGAPTFTGPGDTGPNFTGGSIFGGRTNLAMALPGSFGPGLGAGSGGDMNLGGDYFGRESLRRLMQGRDATLGFGMTGNNTFLPPSQWGGVGAGGNTQGGSRVSGGTITQRRMSQV